MTKPKVRKPFRRTLFVRYLSLALFAVFFSLFVLFLIFNMFLNQNWVTTKEQNLKTNVLGISNAMEQITADTVNGGDVFDNTKFINSMLSMEAEAMEADLFVTDTDGSVLFCKEASRVRRKNVCDEHAKYRIPKDIIQKTDHRGYSERCVIPTISDKTQMIVGSSIHHKGNVVGYVYAVIPYAASVLPYIYQNIRMFVGAALIALMLVTVVSYTATYRLVFPMQEMSRLTKKYAQGDFSERIYVSSNDELSDLAVSLNTMADSLSVLEQSRKSFVSNVSHELKTPMTTIGGFVDGILDGTIPPEQSKKYLNIVSGEVKRLADLVVTMLNLSKIEAGEETLIHSDFDMNRVLFDSLLCFEEYINERNIQIEGFEDMPSVKAYGDEKMLFQVAYNLFDNAVKFTNDGGTIRVEMRESDSRVTVRISNTGKGIPEGELKRVFERFYKLDKSRSEHVKGVGLGLNLVKTIIDFHGGEVAVASVPNEYTSFTFWIPKKGPNMG